MLQLLKTERQKRNVLFDSCVALVLPDNRTFLLCVGKARVTLMSCLASLCSGACAVLGSEVIPKTKTWNH